MIKLLMRVLIIFLIRKQKLLTLWKKCKSHDKSFLDRSVVMRNEYADVRSILVVE